MVRSWIACVALPCMMIVLTSCGGAPEQRTSATRASSSPGHTNIESTKRSPGSRQSASRSEKLSSPEVQGGWTTRESETLAVRGHDYMASPAVAYKNAVKTLKRLNMSVMRGQPSQWQISRTSTTNQPKRIIQALLAKHNEKMAHMQATNLRYSMSVFISDKFGGKVSTVNARVFTEIYSKEFRSWQQLTIDDGSILKNFYGLLDQTMKRR